MSQLLGGTGFDAVLRGNDARVQPVWFTPDTETPGTPGDDFTSPWWPPRSGLLGDGLVDRGVALAAVLCYDLVELTRGRNSRLGYTGVTRDVYNAPLGGVTVKIFDTATDLKASDDVVSDVNGVFVASTPNYAPHWLYMRKAGSPDVGGVSVSSGYPNT